jgi:hypothetical protein
MYPAAASNIIELKSSHHHDETMIIDDRQATIV